MTFEIVAAFVLLSLAATFVVVDFITRREARKASESRVAAEIDKLIIHNIDAEWRVMLANLPVVKGVGTAHNARVATAKLLGALNKLPLSVGCIHLRGVEIHSPWGDHQWVDEVEVKVFQGAIPGHPGLHGQYYSPAGSLGGIISVHGGRSETDVQWTLAHEWCHALTWGHTPHAGTYETSAEERLCQAVGALITHPERLQEIVADLQISAAKFTMYDFEDKYKA